MLLYIYIMPKTKRNYTKYSRRKNSRRKYNRRYKGGLTESRRGSTKAVTNITKTMGQESLSQGGALGWTAIKPGQGKFAKLMQGGVKKVYSANKKILNMYLQIDGLKETFYTDLLSGIYSEPVMSGNMLNKKHSAWKWVNAWQLLDKDSDGKDYYRHKISGVTIEKGQIITFIPPGGIKTKLTFDPLDDKDLLFTKEHVDEKTLVTEESGKHRLDSLFAHLLVKHGEEGNTTSCVSMDYLFTNKGWLTDVKMASDLRSKWVSLGVLAMTAAGIAAVAVGGAAAVGAVTGAGAKLAVGTALAAAAPSTAAVVAAPAVVRESLHEKQTADAQKSGEDRIMRAAGVANAYSAGVMVQGEQLPQEPAQAKAVSQGKASAPEKIV
jgi:hypothetical protein